MYPYQITISYQKWIYQGLVLYGPNIDMYIYSFQNDFWELSCHAYSKPYVYHKDTRLEANHS